MKSRTFAVLMLSFLVATALPQSLWAQEVAVPDKLGVDLEGQFFNLKEHLGKENLYLLFWSTWCGVCKDEIPNLINVYRNVKNVNLVAINPGVNDSLERTRRYQQKYKLPYKIVFDETGASAQAFGVAGIPTAILINKNGEVVYVGFPPPPDQISRYFSS
jgi:thiol-disulfide isomerase/thioredoxin